MARECCRCFRKSEDVVTAYWVEYGGPALRAVEVCSGVLCPKCLDALGGDVRTDRCWTWAEANQLEAEDWEAQYRDG